MSASTKRLNASRAATAYMRQWFRELQDRAHAGEPIVLVNADAPQEIFRALDIPYVVTQWWASVISAKQTGPAALRALRALGYPDDSDQYNAVPLGEALLPNPDRPWGGMPTPSLVVADLTSDSQREVGETWARELGADFFPFERAVRNRVPNRWWDHIADDWEDVVGSDRLSLMEAELGELTATCESLVGRRLDPAALATVLDLVNEQAEWNRRTRALLAPTAPAPIDIADTIPAVMIPQWHRGTVWARDAARDLYHEVEQRIAGGAAVCPDERVRLMWIGRGLWFDPGFVQRFQESHGAVFVWSMYLSIAADGYLRRRHDRSDDIRSIAARFAPFADLLSTPGWVDEWYVKEAHGHRIDGVVHLTANESRSGHTTTAALEQAGIPVLEIDANNADARTWDATAMTERVARFIEDQAAPNADTRRGRP